MFALAVVSAYVGLFHLCDTRKQGAQSLGGIDHRQWETWGFVDLALPSGSAPADFSELTGADGVVG